MLLSDWSGKGGGGGSSQKGASHPPRPSACSLSSPKHEGGMGVEERRGTKARGGPSGYLVRNIREKRDMTGQKAPFQFSMVTKGRDHRHPSPWHKLCLCPTATLPPTPAPVLIKTAMRMQTRQLVCPRSPMAHGGAGKTRSARVELRPWSLVTSWLGENGIQGGTGGQTLPEVGGGSPATRAGTCPAAAAEPRVLLSFCSHRARRDEMAMLDTMADEMT